MKNGSLHKKGIFLFLSERHLSRKERNLYFLPCQMHHASEKDKQIVPVDYMTLKKNVICTFCLAKCIRKGHNNCSFWLHEEWLSSTKRAIFLFLSERHLSRKEGNLYVLPCQMHQKRTNKLFLLTTWRMALFKKENFWFLSERYLSSKRTSFVIFALPNASEKDNIIGFCWLHEEWLSSQKEQFLVPFWTSSF